MKKITIALLLLWSFAGQAQISYEASTNFGKLEDLTYDATVENRIYALTQGNHIVTSIDNGLTWSVKYAFPDPSATITDMKLFGQSALSFVIINGGTQDGVYLFDIATNAITRFYPIPNPMDNAQIMSYSFYDTTGTDLIVHTSYSEGFTARTKVFHTNNVGSTWNMIYFSADHDDVHINNVAFSPISKSKFYMGRSLGPNGINGGLYITEDFGATWTERLPGFTFSEITFNPQNGNDILIGTSIGFGIHAERVYRSTDGGTTWTNLPITWTDQTLNNITKIAFHPTNPNYIILLEENEIVKSTDGGLTWTNTFYPEGSTSYYYGLNASYNPFNLNQVAITTDLFPQFSNDGGTTLTQIRAPYYNVISVTHAKYAANKHLFYGSQGGRLHKNLGTGVTSIYDIEPPTSFNPKRNYMIADPVVAGRVFTYASMGFFGSTLNVSTDYGATATSLMSAFADDMQDLIVDPSNTNIIYVSLRSGEGGNLTKINFTDLENIVTEEITTPEVSEFGYGVVTGISVSAANSNEMYIAKGSKFFKSTDGGVTWVEKINGLTITQGNDLIWDMARNPLDPNHFTVTTNLGVFTTPDAGENWTQVLSGVDAKRIKYSPLNNGVMVAAVHSAQFSDASIYYTVDNGTTWTPVTSQQLNYVQSYSMDFDFDGTTINAYLATTDLGVIKYPILNLSLGTHTPEIAQNPIFIYPNPAKDILNIGVSGNEFEIKSTSIYSITGQKVLESTSTALDISKLSNGVYVVNVAVENGTVFSHKLIKR
ncbi:putative secreted protein (Por secretion system target) [Flavobacterium endophyticum]|uniref:Putative secreted protein (Por secretion system target) n=1 Tax=Flavobacterium endophyticum TaxID=1540163 RepID=A0A495MP50_9FLAO|nr:T9SS type A sorting domain-containing protein [Flavobacterium endophyticum]RKS26593.1 putative secreted protein (Por secretion system target) [Flavobacterium endophyticum]